MKTLKEQAEKIKSLGSPLTIEQIMTSLEKSQSKKSKKSNKNWKRRDELNNSIKKLTSCSFENKHITKNPL